MSREAALRSRSFPATLDSVPEASAWLSRGAADLGLSTAVDFAMALCLEEVLTNIVVHGHATAATLSLAEESPVIRLEIIDDGLAFDPTTAPIKRIEGPLADAEVGGLGIGLLHHFCDLMTYRRDAGKNRLTLEFARTSG